MLRAVVYITLVQARKNKQSPDKRHRDIATMAAQGVSITVAKGEYKKP